MNGLHFSENQKRLLIRKFERSVMAVTRFCLQERIAQHIFRKWLKVSGSSVKESGNFVSVRFVELDGCLFPLVVG